VLTHDKNHVILMNLVDGDWMIHWMIVA